MKRYLAQKFGFYVRNVETGNLLELFLVSAISSLLLVRAYLELTNYPKLGGGQFHIAHMLWGGFLMTMAIFLLLGFLNRQAKYAAAVIGGAGFGMFIDELGKFITADNNYFYRPTVALIYVVFLLLFFAVEAWERYVPISPAGYAVNAIEAIKELVLKDLDESEKQRAMELLEKSDPNDPVIRELKQAIGQFSAKRSPEPSLLLKVSRGLKRMYFKLLHTSWFSQGIVIFFLVFALVGFVRAIIGVRDIPEFADWGELLSSIAAITFAMAGTRAFRFGNRLRAFRMFKVSVIVSILFTQFFLFIKEQLSAVIFLSLSLVVYGACQYLISQEEAVSKPKDPVLA